MIALSPELERYHQQFLAAAQQRTEPEWMISLRKSAMELFLERGFPTRRDEEWKYTSVARLADTAFTFSNGSASDLAGSLDSAQVASLIGDQSARLVFVNGLFRADLSDVSGLPKNVIVGRITEAFANNATGLQPHLGAYARIEANPFVALNTALASDGVYLHVPHGVVVETPLAILYYSDNSGGPAAPIASMLRNLFVIEENAQASVTETYAGASGSVYFTNVVTEIAVAPYANFDHVKVQRESEVAYHIATQQLEQARDSVFTSHNISFGSDLCRNDINARLGGEHIECTVNGLYCVKGNQLVDTHTAIDHAFPNCNSHELYKGIMDDYATGVFNGKIFVRQDAQKTDAKQTNQNLLLSENAAINTKPQLEIYADDVRCTHGATIGQLDSTALFYLRSRGIGEAESRHLLIHAFASDLLGRIKDETLRERLEALLSERLE